MKAIVVGHSGQDGTFLCRSLEGRGYDVFGFSRSSFYSTNGQCLDLKPAIENVRSVYDLVRAFQPKEIYYLAAHHTSSEKLEKGDIRSSFDLAQTTHVMGPLNFLCAIRDISPSCRFFYASSSLVFSGENGEVQDESTPLSPQGFYGITKAEGMWLCREFREKFDTFASVGILYNHESYLRPGHFFSQKIVQTAIRIASGSEEKLVIGDLSAKVDWGYAPEYVEAFQHILKLQESEDFIVATGEAHSVHEFVDIVFGYFDLDASNYVVEDNSILRRRSPVKIGDSSKLKLKTGWKSSRNFPDFAKQLIIDSQKSHVQ